MYKENYVPTPSRDLEVDSQNRALLLARVVSLSSFRSGERVIGFHHLPDDVFEDFVDLEREA